MLSCRGVSPLPPKAPMSAPSSTNVVCHHCHMSPPCHHVSVVSIHQQQMHPPQPPPPPACLLHPHARDMPPRVAASTLHHPPRSRQRPPPPASLYSPRRQLRPRCEASSTRPWHHTVASSSPLRNPPPQVVFRSSIPRSCGSCREGGFHGRMPTRVMITPHLHPPVRRLHRDGIRVWSFRPPSLPRGDHTPCSQVTCDSPSNPAHHARPWVSALPPRCSFNPDPP
jgi:hypothetical protein